MLKMKLFSNSNQKVPTSFKQTEIDLANKSWNLIEQAGLYECGVGLMTR
jgi:hypothetical protein